MPVSEGPLGEGGVRYGLSERFLPAVAQPWAGTPEGEHGDAGPAAGPVLLVGSPCPMATAVLNA